jgi:excisionase family DNA binding protein
MTGELLTIKQVQEILKLSERTVFRLIKNGELQGFKAGRDWRFEQGDIDAYIEHQRKKALDEDTAPRPAIKKGQEHG